MASQPLDLGLESSKPERPQSTKRRRESGSNTNVDDGLMPIDKSSARKRRTSGSSRDTMQRSTTPPETSSLVKYTKTGRVSKATKGQPIHNCDECGKTYTRAEHLRRHQKNHEPGSFPCDIVGCDRSFHREDLLVRHKSRHNDLLGPSSRRSSLAGSGSGPPTEEPMPFGGQTTHPRSSTSTRADVAQPNTTPEPSPKVVSQDNSQQVPETRRPKGYIPLRDLPRGALSVDTNTSHHPNVSFEQPNWDPSPPYSPVTGYESPNGYLYDGPPYYSQPQQLSHSEYANASLTAHRLYANTSRSPISAGSSMTHLPYWEPSAQSPAFVQMGTPSSDHSCGQYNSCNSTFIEPRLLRNTASTNWLITAEERDIMERDDLATPTAVAQAPDFGPHLDATVRHVEERYLSAYWNAIHPLWPVIHRPSFDSQHASPLLRAAMIALGGQSIGEAVDFSNARILHERCNKVLQKRTVNGWHTHRLCDMQATVLIEIYALFKARRPPLQHSRHFEETYRHLADDAATNPASTNQDVPMNLTDDGSLPAGMTREVVCKQRLLVACYILDQQHASLFGRQPCSLLGVPSMHLPFPQPLSIWDGSEASVDSPLPCYAIEAINAIPELGGVSRRPHDIFQSTQIMACLNDRDNEHDGIGWMPIDDTEASLVLLAVEQRSRAKLTYHTFMLCKHTPIRDLLAVAGESWVMAEKLSTRVDYASSQNEVRQWVSASGPDAMSAKSALGHAISILEIHRAHPRTGLLFHEWSIYLAAVVVWVHAYIQDTPTGAPTPTEPRPSSHELEKAVDAIVKGGPAVEITRTDARNVLLWTKEQIGQVDVPHNCGLTNGALDVLGKLIARGEELGWLG